MKKPIDRRGFLRASAGAVTIGSVAAFHPPRLAAAGVEGRIPGSGLKLALNVYSFNQPLRDGSMTLADAVDFCAEHGIGSLDATGYYFPGYPQVPADEFLYSLKRRAFVNGVAIHGTGVRNDFATADAVRRENDVRLVKNWIEIASKLGASVIRVFSGPRVPDGHTFDQALDWMVPHLKECVEHGRRHGVIVGLQNHDDFVRTAEETIRIVEAVDSEWFGLVLDVGSLRQSDPYREIEKLIPYAVSWQLKESVWYGEKETPIDLVRIKTIIEKAGYRGVLPIETLGAGDPRLKIGRFLERVRTVFPL